MVYAPTIVIVAISAAFSTALTEVAAVNPMDQLREAASLCRQDMNQDVFFSECLLWTDDLESVLVESLSDTRYINDWFEMAKFLAFKSDWADSTVAILDYVRGIDEPEGLNADDRIDYFRNKLNILRFVGLMENSISFDILDSAITVEGVERLTEQWPFQEATEDWELSLEHLINFGRQCAAMGAVYANYAPIVEQVEQVNEKMLQQLEELRLTEISGRPMTHEARDVSDIYTGFCSALTTRDMIEDLGLEKIVRASNSCVFDRERWEKYSAPYCSAY